MTNAKKDSNNVKISKKKDKAKKSKDFESNESKFESINLSNNNLDDIFMASKNIIKETYSKTKKYSKKSFNKKNIKKLFIICIFKKSALNIENISLILM